MGHSVKQQSSHPICPEGNPQLVIHAENLKQKVTDEIHLYNVVQVILT